MEPSQAIVDLAGGTYAASLNHYRAADERGLVTTVQVDEWVFAIGERNFAVSRCRLDDWIDSAAAGEPERIECDDAQQAWELLRLMREDCLVWQCGACDGW